MVQSKVLFRSAGIAVIIFELILAWVYYLERTTCFDSAWFSWLFVFNGYPTSFLGRYGALSTQVPPVLALHAGLGLSSVLRIYSLSAVLLPATIWWLVVFRLKDEAVGLAIALVMCVGMGLTFYYGSSELNQGLVWCLLTWALLRRLLRTQRSGAAWIWLMLANIWTSFHHPVLLIPTGYLCVMEWIRAGRPLDRRWAVLALCIFGWFIIRIELIAVNAYEQDRMPGITELLVPMRALKGLWSTQYLLEQLGRFKAYWVLSLVVLLSTVQNRAWAPGLWTLGWTLCSTWLVLVTDQEQRSPMMLENFYPMLSVAVCVHAALAMEGVGQALKGYRPWVIPLVIALALLQVFRAHQIVTDKVAYNERMTRSLARNGVRKAIMTSRVLPGPVVFNSWALAFETALVSAVHGPQHAVTIFAAPDPSAFMERSRVTGAFLGPEWEPVWFNTASLDREYFDLPDGPYTPITGPALTQVPYAGVGLMPCRSAIVLPPWPRTQVELVLNVPPSCVLHALDSSGQPLQFHAILRREDGALVAECDDYTPFERDVGGVDTMGVIIGRPHEPGRYRVEVELEVAGRPTGIRTSFVAEARRFGL